MLPPRISYCFGTTATGCFTFNSMCRSRSCFGSTLLGESVIRHVPFAVFGNAMTKRQEIRRNGSTHSVPLAGFFQGHGRRIAFLGFGGTKLL